MQSPLNLFGTIKPGTPRSLFAFELTEKQLVKVYYWIVDEPFIPSVENFGKKAAELGVTPGIMINVWMGVLRSVQDGFNTAIVSNGSFDVTIPIKEILDSHEKDIDDVKKYIERIHEEQKLK